MRVITLYGRPGCHLCDEAREAIVALRSEVPPFELREVNIEHHDGLPCPRTTTAPSRLDQQGAAYLERFEMFFP